MGKFAKRSCEQMLASEYYEHNNKLSEENNIDEQNCWKFCTEKDKDGETRCDDHNISYDSSNGFPSSSSSSSSSDLIEDTSSYSSLSSMSNGPLFKLSDLMAQLPVKRGLSKYYEGKSQSYATLASVRSLEDLAKREDPFSNKRIKYCKSFCGGLQFDPHTLSCTSNKETTIFNNNHSSNPEALFFFQNTLEKC